MCYADPIAEIDQEVGFKGEKMGGVDVSLIKKILVITKTLRLIEASWEISTRAFMKASQVWGYSHALLKELERLGLIERVERKCGENEWRVCKYNRITGKSRQFLNSSTNR